MAVRDPRRITEVRLAIPANPEGSPLSMPKGMTAAQAQGLVAREALRWTYVLRSRRRWVADDRARERYELEARQALQGLGVSKAVLDQLARSASIVVRVPYTRESELWEARIFPWEYVLAAATREQRVRLTPVGERPALTVMRELQLPAPAVEMRPGREPGDGPHILFVECLPAELRARWSLQSQRERLQEVMPAGTKWHVLSSPTLEELRKALKDLRPQFVHFAGLDSHRGLRELRTHLGPEALVDLGPQAAEERAEGEAGRDAASLALVDEVMADRRRMQDGVLLSNDAGLPRLVRAQELALAMARSRHQAWLVSFNLWNTAARVAPLVVAEGAALAAVGYQDAFDDALADYVMATLYDKLMATRWNLPLAFDAAWRLVRQLPESVGATGVTLWAGDNLLPRRGLNWDTAAQEASRQLRVGLQRPDEGGPIRLDIKPLAELNYAVLHNAQPMFEKFVIESRAPGKDQFVDVSVVVHMGSEKAQFRRRLAMTGPRTALTRAIHVPLTAEVARTVREAISSSIEVEVRHRDETLYRDTHRLRLLPVDQWRDNKRDGRWLPSFVQPRDPMVARALMQAQRYNRVLRDDPNAGFEGYQMADPADEESLRGVDRQVEAIWATLLHDWQLGYINPPPTYSSALDSQRLRTPSIVHEHGAGTCIDLALLFAACLELIDVYPVVFLLEGHALPGWWRHASFRDEYFQMPADNFAEVVQAGARENAVANAQVVAWHTGKASWGEVRRWIRERKLVPIETVRLTEHSGFVEAIEAGVHRLSVEREFDSMLEIVTARTEGVTPLPLVREST